MWFAAKPRQVRVEISLAGPRFWMVLSVKVLCERQRRQGQIIDQFGVNGDPYVCHFVESWSSGPTLQWPSIYGNLGDLENRSSLASGLEI